MARQRTAHFFEGFFHGTPSADAAASIVRNGFNLDRAGSFGTDYGAAVYSTRDKGHAAEHAFGFGLGEYSEEDEVESAEQGRIIPVTLKPERPYLNSLSQNLSHHPVHIQAAATRMSDKENKRRMSEGIKGAVSPDHFIADAVMSHGHDAWIDPHSRGMAAAYDPSKVEVAGEPIDYKRHHGRTPREEWESIQESRGW